MLIRIKRFTLNNKMILFTVILLFVMALTLGFVSFKLANDALNQKGETILKNGVQSAMMLIEQYAQNVDAGLMSKEEAQETLKSVLLGPMQADGKRPIHSPIDLGKYGYYIIYGLDGEEIMHPTLEGVNVWNYVDKDPSAKEPFFLVQDKIEKALNGGGFTYYTWDVPFEDRLAKKVVYSLYYPKWEWVVTAGTYMEDFNKEAKNILHAALLITTLILGITIYVSKVYITDLATPLMAIEKAMKETRMGHYKPVQKIERSDEIGRLVSGYNQMIDALKQKDEKLYHYAYYDGLTGLPNRLMAKEEVENRIKQGIASGQFVLMDIKNFKSINAVYGNAYGDALIQTVGKVMREHRHDSFRTYRVSGNEFGVWIENTPLEKSKDLLQSLCNGIRKTLFKDNFAHSVQFYVGGVPMEKNEQTFDGLYQKATVSLQYAKEHDHYDYVAYEANMHADVKRKEAIEKHAARAISEDGFELYYQSKVDSRSGEVVGVEALARWFSKELGTVSPNEFIAVFSKSHLIIDFTKYVIKKALDDLPHLKRSYGSSVSLSINLCPVIFYQNDFVSFLLSEIHNRNIEPKKIILEITEDFFISEVEAVKGKIDLLRSAGIKIYLDDFGTGFS